MSALRLERCEVDLRRKLVVDHDGGAQRTLTTRESDLLDYLSRHPSIPIRRDTLLSEVWGYSDAVVSRVCDNTMRRLREKVEVDASRPDHLITVHGTGYRFEPRREDRAEIAVAAPVVEPEIAIDGVRIDLARARVARGAETIDLSALEVSLLRCLHQARGAIVSREKLAREVWGVSRPLGRAIDHAIRRLRAKIEPGEHRHLLAGAGGYRLQASAERASPERGGLRGREQILAALRDQIASSGFSLLLGPPGVGKTALARALCRSSEATFVVARSCQTPADLAAAVAMALLVPISGEREDPLASGVDRVGRALASKGKHILVIDSLDGVSAAGPVLARWIDLAADLHILGTSRTRLEVAGSCVIEVSGLSEEDSVSLFVERSRQASLHTRFDADALQDIRRLVGKLEGNPLAIELCAARTPLVSLREMLARLEGLALLDPLNASVDEVIGALEPRALLALLALSLFQRGCTVEDALVLLGDGALDQLQELRDRSLLYGSPRGGSGELRLSLFDIVRERARKLISALPDGGRALVFAHVEHLARAGEEETIARLALEGAAEERKMHRLRVEDLDRAARLALSIGEIGLAERAACAAAHTRWLEGASSLACSLYDLVSSAQAPPSAARARLALLTGRICLADGDLPAARRYLTASRDVAQESSVALLALAYGALAALANDEGDFPGRMRCYTLARDAASKAGALDLVGLYAARLVVKDDPDQAEQILRTSLPYCGANLERRASLLADLSRVAWRRHHLREALGFGREALACLDALGHRVQLTYRHAESVLFASELGETEIVEESAAIGLSFARETGQTAEEANLLGLLGFYRLLCGRSDEALEMLSRAQMLLLTVRSTRGLALVELRLVSAYLSARETASAIDLAKRGALRAEQSGNRWMAARFEALLALASAQRSDPDALALAERSLAALERYRPLDRLIGLSVLGQVLALRGDARAGEVGAKAARLAAEHGLDRPRTEGSALLAALTPK